MHARCTTRTRRSGGAGLGGERARRVTGAVYILHWEPAYRWCRHYIGFTKRGRDLAAVETRLVEHLAGRGNPLVYAAAQAGCQISIVLVIPGNRTIERRLHKQNKTRTHCPVCRTQLSLKLTGAKP